MKTFAEAKKELETKYTTEKMLESHLEGVEAYGFAKAIGFIFEKNDEMIPLYGDILTVLANNLVKLSAEQALNSLHAKSDDKKGEDENETSSEKPSETYVKTWVCGNDIVEHEKGDEDMIEYCKYGPCDVCQYSTRCDDFVFAPRAYKDSGRKFLWIDDNVHFEANYDDIKIFKACKTTKICRKCPYDSRCPHDMGKFDLCPESYILLTEAEFDKKRHAYCANHVCSDCPYKYYCESR